MDSCSSSVVCCINFRDLVCTFSRLSVRLLLLLTEAMQKASFRLTSIIPCQGVEGMEEDDDEVEQAEGGEAGDGGAAGASAVDTLVCV